VAIALATVTNSIAALSVSGVTIKDIDEIPEEVTSRDTPMIIPNPDGFMTGLEITRDALGPAASAQKTISYVLTYRLLYSPIGAARGMFDVYDSMVAKALLFLDAVVANDAMTGSIDVTPAEVTAFGPVADPAGEMFHGCNFLLAVTEFIN
jgi:hypothetical protein